MLPGVMFVVWSVWWCLAASACWHRSARAPREGFVSRAWWPLAPARAAGLSSLEPRLKAALPLLGILGQLYFNPFGIWWRAPLDVSGAHFELDNLGNCMRASAKPALARCVHSLRRPTSAQGSTRPCTPPSPSAASAT